MIRTPIATTEDSTTRLSSPRRGSPICCTARPASICRKTNWTTLASTRV